MADVSIVAEWIRHRAKAHWDVFAQAGNEPPKREVKALEREAGFSLPDAVRDYLTAPLGGLCVVAKGDVWPPADDLEVAPTWRFQNAVYGLTLGSGAPEWMSLRAVRRRWREAGQPAACLPLLQVEQGATWCIGPEGRMYSLDPDLGRDDDDRDFFTIVRAELDALEARLQRYLAGEHRQA